MTEQEWLTSNDPQAMLRVVTPHISSTGHASPFGSTGLRPISDRKLRLFACACFRVLHPNPMNDSEVDKDTIFAAERHADDPRFPLPWLGYWVVSPDVREAAHDAATCTPGPARVAALIRDIAGNPFRPVSIGQDWRPGMPAFVRHGWVQGQPLLTPTVLSLAQAAYDERPGRECDDAECRGRGKWADAAGDACECGACHGTGRIDDGSLDPVRLAVLADALEEAGCVGGREWLCMMQGKHSHPGRAGQVIHGVLHDFNPNVLHHHHDEKCPRYNHPHPLLAHLRSPGPHVRGCWALDLVLGKE